jgi:hypothetical protein
MTGWIVIVNRTVKDVSKATTLLARRRQDQERDVRAEEGCGTGSHRHGKTTDDGLTRPTPGPLHGRRGEVFGEAGRDEAVADPRLSLMLEHTLIPAFGASLLGTLTVGRRSRLLGEARGRVQAAGADEVSRAPAQAV